MRRTTLLLVVIGVLLAVASGVALAVSQTQTGTNGPDTLTGTTGVDKLAGGGGDTINAKAGDDLLFGDSGSDTFNAGDGADFIKAADLAQDDINCGGGSSDDGFIDTVFADPPDNFGASCNNTQDVAARGIAN